MSATTIISNGALYRAGQKTWVTHGRRRFHVFDRADSKGTRLDNGTVLDKHEIDLSTWQLENVNAEYFLLFDHPLYVKLKKSIAKTLLPLLHTWLFAARREERFEKLYPELCEALQITCYSHRSRITEQLQPALNELVKLEYLSKWELLKTSNTKTYKIAFYAGPKAFHTRRRQRKALPEPEEAASGAAADTDKNLLQQLDRRGISDPDKLLFEADNEFVADCIEYWDSQANVRPALLVALIRRKVALPTTFETTAQRRQRETEAAEEHRQAEEAARWRLKYLDYQKRRINEYITNHSDQYQRLLKQHKQRHLEALEPYKMSPKLKEQNAERAAEGPARKAIADHLNLLTLDQYKGKAGDSASAETGQQDDPEKSEPQRASVAPTADEEPFSTTGRPETIA